MNDKEFIEGVREAFSQYNRNGWKGSFVEDVRNLLKKLDPVKATPPNRCRVEIYAIRVSKRTGEETQIVRCACMGDLLGHSPVQGGFCDSPDCFLFAIANSKQCGEHQ